MRTSLVLLLILVTCQVVAAGEIADVVAATVLIEVDHLFSGRTITTTGSGFFIHPDGLLISNSHVVNDKVDLADGRTARAKVVDIRVIIDSGSSSQRVLDATLLSRDEGADLALLRARFRPEAWLDPADAVVPQTTDEVWVAGYPLGDFLSVGGDAASGDLGPAATLNSGRVTSIRRNGAGHIEVIQTDAAINPGNSGGPLVDAERKLVGVVTSKIFGAAGLGFAVPAAEVQRFLRARGFEIRFQPPVVSRGMSPLHVIVESSFADPDGFSGKVTLEGGSSEPAIGTLNRTPTGWAADVPVSDHHVDAAIDGNLRAEIQITGEGGDGTVRRIFRIRADRGSRAVRQEEVSSRSVVGSQTSSQAGGSFLGGGRLGGEKVDDNRTSTVASEASVVIDNSLMYHKEGFARADWRYQGVPLADDRQLLMEYETTIGRMFRSEYKAAAYRKRWEQQDVEKSAYYRDLQNEAEELRKTAESFHPKLKARGLCRCGLYWFPCSDAACDEPEKPWIEGLPQ